MELGRTRRGASEHPSLFLPVRIIVAPKPPHALPLRIESIKRVVAAVVRRDRADNPGLGRVDKTQGACRRGEGVGLAFKERGCDEVIYTCARLRGEAL